MVPMKYREVRIDGLLLAPGLVRGNVVFAGWLWKNRCEF